jgi:tetratricopeptide (TPR) repeat protein
MLIRFASLLLLVTLAGCATKAPLVVVDDLTPKEQPLAEDFKVTYEKGLVLLQDGEYDEAVIFWKALSDSHPHLPGVWTNYGLALYHTGEYQASLDALAYVDGINAKLEAQLGAAKQQVLSAAVVSDSDLTPEELNAEPPAIEEGTDVALDEEAVQAANSTAVSKPIMLKPYCPVHGVRALPQRELGLFTAAEKSYKAAIACNSTDAKAHYNLGILFDLYRNDLVSALAEYKQARVLMGDDKTLDVWIADLERRSGIEEGKE